MTRMRYGLGGGLLCGLMAACGLAVTPPAAGVQFYSDGIVREVAGDVAVVELPKWPLTVEKGMKVAFFDIADVFAKEGSGKVLVAKINVTAIGRIIENDEETARVSLSDISGKGRIRPSTGNGVLINNTLKHGWQYVVRDDSLSAKLIFEENFNEGAKVGIFWESLPGAISIEKGKLLIDRYKKELEGVESPHKAAAMIKLNVMAYAAASPFNQEELTRGGVCFEFDLETKSGIKISLDSGGYGRDLIGLDYVIGRYEEIQPGIYVKDERLGKLSGLATGSKHVLLTTTPSYAELRMDGNVCKVKLPKTFVRTPFRNVVIFTKGKFALDNFRIWKLQDDSAVRNAAVIAFNNAKDEVAVLKGNSKEWQGSLAGREILFGKDGAKGIVLADLKDYAVCEVSAKETAAIRSASAITVGRVVRYVAPSTDNEDVVSTSKTPMEDDLAAEKPPLPDAAASVQSVYDELRATANGTWELGPIEGATAAKGAYVMASARWTSEGKMSLNPASEVKLEASGLGYVYPVRDAFAQPISGQVLGVRAGKAIRCQIARERDGLSALPVDLADAAAMKRAGYCIVSSQQTKSSSTNQVFELTGQEFACDFSSTRQTFWNVVSGKWTLQKGRFVSGSPLDKEGVPAIVAAHGMDGNFRFDFDVIVEKPVKQIFCTYTKDISCMFYSPSAKRGLTFGFGAEGYGGISTDKGIPGAVQIDIEKTLPREQTKGKEAENTVLRFSGHGQYLGKNLEARLGKSYHIRIEKHGSKLVMFINGRRIHEEDAVDLAQPLQTWILSPESVISIDNTSLTKLPGLAGTPASAPLLGCFGYVVAVDGQDVYIDSGMPGLRKGQRVTIAFVEKQMRSKSDPGRILSQQIKPVASGTVAECGSTVTRVTVLNATEPVRPGMKALTRKCAGTFSLSEQELGDIDEEL